MGVITQRKFGITRDGDVITNIRIENSSGAYVEVLNYGCTIRAVSVPDRYYKLRDVCLGFDFVQDYEESRCCAGATMGRCTSRIRGAKAVISGREYPLSVNARQTHFHGGIKGFDKHIWQYTVLDDGVCFSRLSEDGEEGYPGNFDVQVKVTFSEQNVLELEFSGTADADTIVNMTNHAYWNLSGHASSNVGDHLLQIHADRYTPFEPDGNLTGGFLPVDNSAFDFRKERQVADGWDAREAQILLRDGYDHNWEIRGSGLREAATLYSRESGILMCLSTTQTGLQVYTANHMKALRGKNGAFYGPRSSIALEAQGFPDAVNCPRFPSVVLHKGQEYRQKIQFAFCVR